MTDNELSVQAEPVMATETLQTPAENEPGRADEAGDMVTNYLKGWPLFVVTIA